MLVTEKDGDACALASSTRRARCRRRSPGVPEVDARSQGGLLDVALGPRFAQDQMIYWCYSDPAENGMNHTAVARGKLVDGAEPRLDDVQTIYRQGPSLNSRHALRLPPGVEP